MRDAASLVLFRTRDLCSGAKANYKTSQVHAMIVLKQVRVLKRDNTYELR